MVSSRMTRRTYDFSASRRSFSRTLLPLNMVRNGMRATAAMRT
jgi:hypothetical protein